MKLLVNSLMKLKITIKLHNYFAKLLVKHGANYLDFITKEKYKGLHNSFEFAFNPEFGYYNIDLMLVQYKNSTLNRIN